MHMSESTAPPADLQQFWDTNFEKGVAQVLRGEPISFEMHTAMYTAEFNWCTSSKGESSESLHKKLTTFFDQHTKTICEAAPADNAALLEYYNTQWECFGNGAVVVDRIFSYLNRYHVERVVAEGAKDVHHVKIVAVHAWKANVFDSLSSRLSATNENVQSQLDAIKVSLESGKFAKPNVEEMKIKAA